MTRYRNPLGFQPAERQPPALSDDELFERISALLELHLGVAGVPEVCEQELKTVFGAQVDLVAARLGTRNTVTFLNAILDSLRERT